MSQINDLLAVCTFIPFYNSENNYVIAKFKALDGGMNFTAKGAFFVEVGKEYYVTGIEEENDRFKNTFKAINIKPNIDLSKAGKSELITYLSTVTSSNIAKLLVEEIPDIVQVIENKDIETLSTVKGVGEHVAVRIIELHSEQIDFSEAIIGLSKFGFTKSAIITIVNHFKSAARAVEEVNKNPYVLTKVKGYGFKKCDALFLLANQDNPNATNDTRRIQAYVDYLFEEEGQNGNTWLSPKEFMDKVLTFIPEADIKDAIAYINTSKDYLTLEAHSQKRITSKRYMDMELEVAERLLNMTLTKPSKEIDGTDNTIFHVETNQGFVFDEDQRKAINEMLDKNIFLLQGGAGTGKAQPNDTLIPVPEGGTKELGDIKVGDYVFNRLGEPVKVLGVYPQGKLDNYKVTLNDGRVTYSNDEHLWTYITNHDNKFKTETLRQIMDRGIYCVKSKNKKPGLRYKVPNNKSVKYSEKEFDLKPYTIGAIIGDGCTTGANVSLSNSHDFIPKKIASIEPFLKDSQLNKSDNHTHEFILPCEIISDKKWGRPRTRWQVYDIPESCKEIIGYSHEKHIPEQYMYGSESQRWELVQGLMDTDGCISLTKWGGNLSYSTSSKKLTNQLVSLLRSLGVKSSVHIDDRSLRFEDRAHQNLMYDIRIKCDNSIKYKFFTFPPKLEKALSVKERGQRSVYSQSKISSIEPTGERVEMTCIQVDDVESLYLTNDFIVTHNTTVINGVSKVLRNNGISIAQTALSGRAANNLEQVTGLPGKTIHSLIGFGSQHPKNEDNPLPFDVVIVDEISMVNIEIFLALLKAMKPDAKLIMLGDAGQLDSIGVGVMNGIMMSGKIPEMTLTQIHRQAKNSAIITHSIAVRNGSKHSELVVKSPTDKIYGVNKDLEYIFVKNSEEANIYKQVMIRFRDSLAKYGVDGTQILCAAKNAGNASVNNLNYYAQILANPKDPSKREFDIKNKEYEYQLREGDKVINTKNNYKTLDVNGIETPIFNGNTGTILSIDGSGSRVTSVIRFDGVGDVVVPLSEKDSSIQHGYAITSHKSQGSTIPSVIIALPFHFMLNSRELLYTAITRASKNAVLITSPKTYQSTLRKTSKRTQQTNLAIYLQDLELYTDKLSQKQKGE